MSSLQSLPEVRFVETDAAAIEAATISRYETVTGRTAHPGTPERLFLEAVAYVIADQQSQIEDAARLNLLAYSRGDYLDQMGGFFGALGLRLVSKKATVTLQFSIPSALGYDVAIPLGTRATPDGSIVFETIQAANILAGNNTVEVEAQCRTEGASGNGYAVGQINRLVDVPANVNKVTNTTVSSGGADRESDSAFQSRLYLAAEGFAIAGPKLANEFHARSVDPGIVDVLSTTAAPGLIRVYILMEGGALPSQTLLDAVEAYLNDESRRPTTFQLIAAAPEPVEYDLTATYYIFSEYSTQAAEIQSRAATAKETYLAWQKGKLARDINPDYFKGLLLQIPGIKRVDLSSPAYTVLTQAQIAFDRTVEVTYGGLEDV